jgi:hypothetical protein
LLVWCHRAFGFFARHLVLVLFFALTGCVEGVTVASSNASDFIVVSDFVAPEGVVHLDSSFGFSLYRGEAGVPTQRRAASIGRAVAFLVTDTITERLRARGYDAVSTINPSPGATGHRALLVSGTFRAIDEGQRRRVGNEQSAVIANIEIKAESASGTQTVQRFTVDSRSAPQTQAQSGATKRETGVDADAARVGAEIARVVAEIARRNNWVPAAR